MLTDEQFEEMADLLNVIERVPYTVGEIPPEVFPDDENGNG
jgi:predicted house-cleaning noncanonical NTP pyrophosphatase (MazG superfamily)